MTMLRLTACLALTGLAGCAIPMGEPIGTSRLVAAPGPAGSMTLTAPSCPDWRRDSREDFSNRVSSNFGCADAVNFLGQLADPSDAIAGRATDVQDGRSAGEAVERYRARKTVPLGQGSPAAGASLSGPSS